MFYILYTSSEYYETNKFNMVSKVSEPEEKACIVCWMPSLNDNDNELHSLKEFKEYIVNCSCNVSIHKKCLYKWLQNSSTCPICRKSIIYNILYDRTNNYKLFAYYFIFYNCIIKCLRIASYVSILNLFMVLLYNTCYIYNDIYNYYEPRPFLR